MLIALAGPVFGLLAMAPFFMAYAWTGDGQWLGGAFFIAAINLLNLAPAPPLDGSKAFGPVLARVHPWLERAALLAIGGVTVLWALNRGSYVLAIFIGLGMFGAMQRGRLRPFAQRLTVGESLATLGLYAGAVALCVGAVAFTLNGPIVDSLRRFLGL